MESFVKKFRKYWFRVFLVERVTRRYAAMSAVFSLIISADPAKLFVMTVAWNDAETIALNHLALKKHMKDSYEYFVFDNSTEESFAEATKKYCLENKVNYIRLPKNPGLDGSMHHGLALNWMYRNVIERYKPENFLVIDPDLFPIEDFCIGDYLKKGDAWGIITERKSKMTLWRHRWYLWIGLAAFRRSWFKKGVPNFLPGWGTDTGGRISVDPTVVRALPDVHHHLTSPTITLAPGVRVYQYGAFIHFTGAAWDAPESLAVKKAWIAQKLGLSWPL